MVIDMNRVQLKQRTISVYGILICAERKVRLNTVRIVHNGVS